ncbi:hypothetical protein HPP92_007476 [Vanilla planifolia]|uniref:Uncharacterized protein n=1 Tax=Vanilla planifolia TaxID=51239 RepID=A0A835VAP6_VANPL|nr:hypothetical protein HPP92_007476 [Vanilla planifolia]
MIYCYDLRKSQTPCVNYQDMGKAVSHVKFVDCETVVSASTDNTLKLWDLNKTSSSDLSTNACSLTFAGHTNEKNFVGLSACDGYIACGSETNEKQKRCKKRRPVHGNSVDAAGTSMPWGLPCMVRRMRWFFQHRWVADDNCRVVVMVASGIKLELTVTRVSSGEKNPTPNKSEIRQKIITLNSSCLLFPVKATSLPSFANENLPRRI